MGVGQAVNSVGGKEDSGGEGGLVLRLGGHGGGGSKFETQ